MSNEQKLPVTLEELEQYLATTKSRMPGVRIAEMLQDRTLQFDRPPQIVDLITRSIATLEGPEDETELPGGRRGSRRQKSHCILLHTRAYAHCLSDDFDNAEKDATEAYQLAQSENNPTLEGEILNLRGDLALKSSHPEKAQEMFEAAFEIGARINSAAGISRSLHHLSDLYHLQGNNDKSIRMSGIALERLRGLENAVWEIVMALMGRGRAFFDAERYTEALECYREVESTARGHGHTYFEIVALDGCAQVYLRLGDYAAALQECRTALKPAMEKSLAAPASYVESTIGSIYVRMEEHEAATGAFTRSLTLAESAGSEEGVLNARTQLANIALRTGKAEEALAVFQQSLDFYEERANISAVAYFVTLVAKAQETLGRTAEAEENYRRGIAIAVRMKANERIAAWSLLLGELHATAGHDEKALPCFEQALTHVNVDHPAKLTVDIYAALWDLYERTGRTSEALDICRRHRLTAAQVASQLAGVELQKIRVLYDIDTLKSEAEIAARNQRKAEADLQEGIFRLEQAIFQMEEMRETMSALQDDLKTAVTAFDSARVEEGITILKRVQHSLSINTEAEEKDMAHFSTIDKAFRERLQVAYPTLTATQIRLCGLLHAGYPNKTVASILHITPGAVKKSRYRLRAHFGLDASDRLETFLAELTGSSAGKRSLVAAADNINQST